MRGKQLFSTIFIGILVFAAIVWVLGPDAVWDQVSKMKPEYLLLALGIQALAMVAMAQRWAIFIKATGHKAEFSSVLLMTIAGTAMNNITPSSRMGGEPLRAYLLKKRHGARTSTGLATVVIEKIADMTAFSIITILAIFYAFYYLNVPGHTVLLLALSFLFTTGIMAALVYVTLRRKIKAKWIVGLIDKYQRLSEKFPLVGYYRDKLDDSLANYYDNAARIAKKGVLIKAILASLVYWALEISRAYVIFLALGINVPIAVIAAVYVIANIVASLPLPPGTLEATMIIIYSSTAINTVTAGAVTLIDRLISFWLVIIAGLPVAWHLGLTTKK
ncbi:flippase-like domain-containing protein [archaeon]